MNHQQLIKALEQTIRNHYYYADLVTTDPIQWSGAGVKTDSGELYPMSNDFLANTIKDIWFEQPIDGRTTTHVPGVVEASEQAITWFDELNQSKQYFKETNLQYRKENPNNANNTIASLSTKGQKVLSRDERYDITMDRLNINQVYRQFKVFTKRPYKISFTNSRNEKSIKRVTRSEAVNLLINLYDHTKDNNLEIEIKRLAATNDNEPLAIVRPQTPSLKANVFMPGRKIPIKILASLPIIICSGEKPVKIDTENLSSTFHSKGKRVDTRLSQEPLAPSIHLYKYEDIIQEA